MNEKRYFTISQKLDIFQNMCRFEATCLNIPSRVKTHDPCHNICIIVSLGIIMMRKLCFIIVPFEIDLETTTNAWEVREEWVSGRYEVQKWGDKSDGDHSTRKRPLSIFAYDGELG